MDDTDLRQIISDILNGDTTQFERIMHKYQRPIFLYCYHMLNNYAEAEDYGQEVFLKAFRHMGRYDPEKSFEAWLYTIAYNQCIDALRKRKLVKYLPFLYHSTRDYSPIDQRIEDIYFDEQVLQAMHRLSAEERSLLILRCVEDKTYEEISTILQRSNAYLRKKYERTVGKFRKHYYPVKGASHNETKQRSGSSRTIS